MGYLPQELDVDDHRTVLNETYQAFPELLKIQDRQEEISVMLNTREDYESQSYQELIQELTDFVHGHHHYLGTCLAVYSCRFRQRRTVDAVVSVDQRRIERWRQTRTSMRC